MANTPISCLDRCAWKIFSYQTRSKPKMTSEATTSRNAPVTPIPRGVLFRILAVWTKQELLLLVREPIAVFFRLAFPLVIYMFIGLPYADNEVSSGIRFIDFMFPTLIGTIAVNLLVMGLPIYLAELRRKGVGQRYRAMRIPGGIFAAAVILATLALVVAASIIIIVVVSVVNGLRPEVLGPAFLGLVLLLISWLCCIGYFLGSLPTSSRTPQAISTAVFFTMFFGSGSAAQIDGLPG